MTGKKEIPHLKKREQYTRDMLKYEEPWTKWERRQMNYSNWEACKAPLWFIGDVEYRRIPDTISIAGRVSKLNTKQKPVLCCSLKRSMRYWRWRMSDLVNRLRGIYTVGPVAEDGTAAYGTRSFSDFIPPISLEAANKIEELEAENARLKAGWISVNDNVPKMGGKVLCRYAGVYENRIATFWLDGGGNTHFGCNLDSDGKGSQPITHWMPLPEPPQEQPQ